MDDLTRIKGIGKATAAKLSEAGITTFAALAEADPARDDLGLSAAELSRLPDWSQQAHDIHWASGREDSNGNENASDAAPSSDEEPAAQDAAGEGAGNGSEGEAGTNDAAPQSDTVIIAQAGVGGGAGDSSPPETEKPAAAHPIEVLVVTGPKRGRRRASRSFGPSPVDVPIDELTEDEVAAIEGDPALSTRRETRPAT